MARNVGASGGPISRFSSGSNSRSLNVLALWDIEFVSVDLNIHTPPLGELAAQRLVHAVAKHDDRIERFYLELKGPLDMGSKVTGAVIAKFILGAANRQPEIAAKAFGGYGVMVIGVTKDEITGMPPIEMMEIARRVERFIGVPGQGPRWDVIRVPAAEAPNEVLIVVVDPPAAGDALFVCRDDGEGLKDGRIYIRADGETREAQSGEMDLLIARASKSPSLATGFAVGFTHPVEVVEVDAARSCDEYIARERQTLLTAMRDAENEINAAAVSGIGALAASAAKPTDFFSNFERPEDRTSEQYIAEIDAWEDRLRAAWPSAVDAMAGWALRPAELTLTNTVDTFFRDVRLHVHLEGAVKAVFKDDDESLPSPTGLGLPPRPRMWGPRSLLDFANGYNAPMIPIQDLGGYASSLTWSNSGSVDLDFEIGDLRPQQMWTYDEQEITLLLHNDGGPEIHGTWRLTARDHHQLFTGTVTLPTAEPVDLTRYLRQSLSLNPATGGSAE